MEEENKDRIYKYGDSYYSIDVIYDIYRNCNYFKTKKTIKDCICNYILSEILKRGGLEREGNTLDSLTTYRLEHLDKKMSKSEMFAYNKNLFLRGLKILGLAAVKNKYRADELMNGEWVLNKLIYHTLGNSYSTNQIDDFILINYVDLSHDQCVAIAQNFLRNLWNDELIKYKYSSLYEDRKQDKGINKILKRKYYKKLLLE